MHLNSITSRKTQGSSWGKNQVTTARVLLVEDEGFVRLIMAEVLRDEGFEVTEAWNGDQAVRLLDGPNSFDVLFTDVRMPGTFDGIDVAVHARLRYPALPVLVVSGYATQLALRLSLLNPPAVFISKPYRLTQILEALNGSL